jgi:hypothetical protein
MLPGPAGAIAYVGGALKRFPDLHVAMEDMIAEDDCAVVRNYWTATDSQAPEETRVSRDCHLADRRAPDCGAMGVFEPPHEAGSEEKT